MSLADRLRARIDASGPLSVAAWMAACNAHYYATRDPLGRDFTTAPEISQMFGELVGLALADAWVRAGSPADARLVELGPGRGTLMADVLRATARVAGFARQVHFVETSPVLRAAQAARAPNAVWHDALATVPGGAPLLLVANEFFDALPVRQHLLPVPFAEGAGGWQRNPLGGGLPTPAPRVAPLSTPPRRGGGEVERTVTHDGTRFVAPAPGVVTESSPAARAIAAAIGDRLRADGGAALIIDYGYLGRATGDTLQAVRAGRFADPFADPGDADLTCHVDFTALADAARATRWGPVGQGAWLKALGIDTRAAVLRAGGGAGIDAAVARLTGEAEMGTMFKVLGLTGPGWSLAGFAA